MTQPQVIQEQYKTQFKRFSAMLLDLHPEFAPVAWNVASKEGLEAAIAFCESKIFDSQLMQVYRECEK